VWAGLLHNNIQWLAARGINSSVVFAVRAAGRDFGKFLLRNTLTPNKTRTIDSSAGNARTELRNAILLAGGRFLVSFKRALGVTQMGGNTRKSKQKGPTRCQRVKKKKTNEDGDDDDGIWKCTERAMEEDGDDRMTTR
jgi:hypothetical protein